MDNFIPQGGGTLWATLCGSGIVFSTLFYKAYRLIKGDLRDDKTVQNVDKFVETQNTKIKGLEDLNKLLSERIESIQKERGTAMALSGQLQGQIDGWKLITDNLKEQRDQKDKEITNLKDENAKMKSQIDNLLKISNFIKPESLGKQQSETPNG